MYITVNYLFGANFQYFGLNSLSLHQIFLKLLCTFGFKFSKIAERKQTITFIAIYLLEFRNLITYTALLKVVQKKRKNVNCIYY